MPQPNPEDQRSAFQNHLGYEIRVFEPDRSVVEMPIADFLMNRSGIPHGGAIAALLDTAMGLVGYSQNTDGIPTRALTLNISVNFLAQARGQLLIATATKTGGGRKTYFANGEVRDDTGTLIATATGVFKITPAPVG